MLDISMIKNKLCSVLCLSVSASFLSVATVSAQTTDKEVVVPPNAEKKSEWVQMFNGKDLTGWTPKFKGSEAGVNFKNVFKVRDGKLVVDYSEYGAWDGNFGHLFYDKPFSHYVLRAEYRFIGEQASKGPGWAWRNNGFMIHGQTLESMKKDQPFPASIEVQLLGGGENGERGNLNICTPGTQIEHKGKLTKAHVINAGGPTNRGEEWVTVEIEVRGSDVIRHKQDGKLVVEYNKPQLDDGTLLEGGTISIQAETAPIEFRKIEIKELKPLK